MVAGKQDSEINEIKISVVIPVYNVENYLEECINSLLRQTFKQIEIILVNDGSTDLSGTICDIYAEKYSNIIVIHKVNEGQGKARNIGLSLAKGKYVYFMDSDDWLDKEAFNFLYAEAETKMLDVIMFSAECFSDDLNIEYNPNAYLKTKNINEIKTGEEMFASLFTVGEYNALVMLRFYRRDYLYKGAFLFPEGIIHEDELFGFLSLVEANRVECIPFRFYKHRIRKGSTMTSKKAYSSAIGYVYTWKELMKINYENQITEKESILTFAHGFLRMVRDLYISFNKTEKKEFMKIRADILNLIELRDVKIENDIKLFLVNPFIYKQYKRLLKILNIVRKRVCI